MNGRKPVLKSIEGGLSNVPPPPKGLGPEARAEWSRAAKDLIDRKVLARSDLPTLEQYAIVAGMVKKLQPIAAGSDPVIVAQSGAVKQHPAHVMLAKYLNLCLRYSGELGLTPASRNRKSFNAGPAGDDPWADMDL